MTAAISGGMETFQVLLDHGVTWEPQDEIVIPLGFRRRWNGWLRRLLRKKRPKIINWICRCRRWNGGRRCCMRRRKAVTHRWSKLLLNAGADPNILNICGDLPLDWAEQKHIEKLVECLRDAGAKRSEEPPHETNENDMESEYS